MYIITATFDADAAFARTAELLALGDSPERLAERLGITRELPVVKQGVQQASFRRLIADVKGLKKYVEVRQQIEDVKNGKSMMRFLGEGFKEKQLAKLDVEVKKFGSLIDAPAWFYQQPRVQLLSAIRDSALDGAQQGDAVWTEVEREKLIFPIAAMFESADGDFARELVAQLEKPLKDTDPRFILEKFEGNRSINFDFDKGVAMYYTPAPAHG
ncbi:MAG TPA: hypothetical protein VHY09_11645 [Candidatus Methylacidiphilales bacterium]|jgi:hypothetical protein|nr:hypothetical protein [Candidatus Methylacidiphilales bacterium]